MAVWCSGCWEAGLYQQQCNGGWVPLLFLTTFALYPALKRVGYRFLAELTERAFLKSPARNLSWTLELQRQWRPLYPLDYNVSQRVWMNLYFSRICACKVQQNEIRIEIHCSMYIYMPNKWILTFARPIILTANYANWPGRLLVLEWTKSLFSIFPACTTCNIWHALILIGGLPREAMQF